MLGQPVNYSVNSPRVYGNADYVGNGGNNNWDASVQVRTKFGKSVSGATLTAPTATNDMVVNFVTTDKTLEDSILTVYVIVNDKGNGCDTVIKRAVDGRAALKRFAACALNDKAVFAFLNLRANGFQARCH